MTDASNLSDDELSRIAGGSSSDLSSIPDEHLAQIANASDPLTAGQTFAGGMSDLLNKLTLGAGTNVVGTGAGALDVAWPAIKSIFSSGQEIPSFENAVNNRVAQVKELTKGYQEQNPISSMFANTAGLLMPVPDVFSKAPGVAATVGNIAKGSALGAGLGGAAAFNENNGGLSDSAKAAGLGAGVGAVTGGALSAAGSAINKALDFIGPQSEAGAIASVGNSLGKYVDPSEVRAGINAVKGDSLGALRTSAEVTKSPELAILEQQLGSSGAKALDYAAEAQQRKDATQWLLDQASTAKGVRPEDTGLALQTDLAGQKAADKAVVKSLYDKIPKDTLATIPKAAIQDSKTKYFGTGDNAIPLPSELQARFDTLVNPDNLSKMSIGDLQLQRSHLIDISKAASRAGNNEASALASELAGHISDTIGSAPAGATEWQTANKAAAQYFGKYGGFGKVQAPLRKVENLQPSQVYDKILSSPEASAQAANILGQPGLTKVKDQLVSDLGSMSDAQKANFIDNHSSQIENLLGKNDASYMFSIRDGIRSRISASTSANAVRGSNTALKLSDVMTRALTGKESAQTSGLWNVLKTGITGGGFAAGAAYHPALAVPAALAALAVKGLRDRSSRLVGDAAYNAIMQPRKLLEALNAASAASPGVALASGAARLNAPVATLMGSLFSSSPKPQGTRMDTNTQASQVDPVSQVEAKIDANPYYSTLYQAESGRNPNAKNPTSSAKGGFQFIDSTANSVGLKDPFDLGQSFEAIRKLTAENRARFGDDPNLLYSAHYLGATLLDKVLKGKTLTADEQAHVNYLKSKALPHFQAIYASKQNNSGVA